MPDALIAKAELIADWLEAALLAVREHPRAFADLDPFPIEQGLFFLRERFLPEVRERLRLPLTALICGGTNTGKSTMFNSLMQKVGSPSGGTASLTKRLMASGTESALQQIVQARVSWKLLSIDSLQHSEKPDATLYSSGHPGADDLPLLIDSPDIDSSDRVCHRLTRRGLAFADLLIWVTTQQKYKDQAGIQFLDEALKITSTRFEIFNQAIPRHLEALEDMHRAYDERWPSFERYRFRMDEDRTLEEHGVLPLERIEPLRARLREIARQPRQQKIRSLGHGVEHQSQALRLRATEILQRQEEVRKEERRLKGRLEEHLFARLRHLRGHDNPLELQAAMIRVIGPKLQTVIGDAVNTGLGALGRTLGRLRSMLFGRPPSGVEPDGVDVKQVRDRQDLREALEVLELARSDLLERARRKAQRGHPLFVRLRDALQKIPFPQGSELEESLKQRIEKESTLRLGPLVLEFEHDLEEFCRQNPEVISILKVSIPGLAALAGFTAAVVGVHALAALPGVMEYFLGGIAIPVYRALERALPEQVVGVIDRISREPFLTRTRDRFIQTRRDIFAEAGVWISKPVQALFTGPDIALLDIQTQLDHLNALWKTYAREAGERTA